MATTPRYILTGGTNYNVDDGASNYLTPAEQQDLVRAKALQDAADQNSGKKKTNLLDILNGAASVVGTFFGQKQAAAQTMPMQPYYPAPEKKSNTGMYIMIAVVVVIIIGAVILLTKKKKAV